jgi:hypothetical protein
VILILLGLCLFFFVFARRLSEINATATRRMYGSEPPRAVQRLTVVVLRAAALLFAVVSVVALLR